ncbi:uncharacterized protein LOC133886869 [Phragmites australis]|uniref:uncharacterized protein LOC133886869 n=1 Tax=Phragmites australis TaxID=29695 RepID=UPI002D795563|nr:uncharacterized protein LOC133886869 [Phragmites australis]
MAQRWRSGARRDPDLDDDGGSPPSSRRRRSDEEDEELGNEDLSLEIVARAVRRQRHRRPRRSEAVADVLSLSSGEEEGVDEDAVVELGEAAEPRRNQRKKQRRKQKKKQRKEATDAAAAAVEEEVEVGGTQEGPIATAESVLTEGGADVPASDNMVLRKLLRVPRYFDPGETLLATCFNCGEEGHVAANCQMEKRKKPCFVCGLFGHNAKQCTQGQDCFICKKGGHMAKDCPDKHKRNNQQSTLCLRCGETGHDMFGCVNDYPSEDIKEIRCYLCKQNGHLCCADFSDKCPKEITCYNCAQSGHSGLGCAKQRRETSAVTTPTLCYKCGEEGHFARGCIKNAKSDWSKGESSAHSWRKDKGKKDFSARSAPYDARKTSKRKSPRFEERMDTPRHKSKARGGWTGGDDLDDLPFKKYRSNGWASPSTPKKPYSNRQYSSGFDYLTPQSSRRHNNDYASPVSNYSPSARKHGFSSRFAASNTHVRFGRS